MSQVLEFFWGTYGLSISSHWGGIFWSKYLFQSTRPDTVGIGLTTSPLGLAAYIIEKFSSFSNAGHISQPDGNLPQMFTQDEILDNLMVYWLTGSITSSMRFYKENMRFDTAGQHLQAYQTWETFKQLRSISNSVSMYLPSSQPFFGLRSKKPQCTKTQHVNNSG